MKRSCNNAALIVTQTPTMSDWIRFACKLTNAQMMIVKPWRCKPGGDGFGTGRQRRRNVRRACSPAAVVCGEF